VRVNTANCQILLGFSSIEVDEVQIISTYNRKFYYCYPVECWWDSILKVLRVMNFNYKNNAHYKAMG
jgi:hypothetical protein